MARIRTVKPEYWTSEQVMECSPITRLAFVGMWNFCDDGGNHPASAKTLKAEVFPGDDMSSQDVQECIDELHGVGLLMTYEVAGKQYWHVTGWNHQKIDKPTIKHPSPPKSLLEVAEGSASPRREVSESSPPEGKVRESIGNKDKPKADKPPVSDYPEPFIEAWNTYPSRPGSSKVDAFKQWKARIAEGESPDVIAEGVTRYAAYCLAMKTERNFIKMPATFFGRGKHYLSDWTPVETQGKEKSNADSRADVIAAFTGRRRESTVQGAIEGDYRTVESG